MSNNAMSNETDLDWMARNVHEWPAGECQPWCYVYMVPGGAMKAAGNFLDAVASPTMITIIRWLSRRAELQNKPSWQDAPEWASCIVQDKLGNWYFCSDTPNLEFNEWGDECVRKSLIYSGGVVLGDWRDTLEKRPEEFKPSIEEANRLAQEFKPFTSIEDNQEFNVTKKHEMKQDNGWYERGELPPVGVRCIALQGIAPKANCEVIAKTTQQIVVRWEENGLMDVIDLDLHVAFRPISTEREMAIEEMKQACPYHGCWDQVGRIYAEALYDAGYRKEGK